MTGRIIVIEGVIGAGKSTMARMLGEQLGAPVIREPVDDNDGLLARFYADPGRWAFEFQMRMLVKRHAAQQEAAWRAVNGERAVILDRSMVGDRVFAELHRDAGNISADGWATYVQLFEMLNAMWLPPTLLIHLDVRLDRCLERIAQRGRTAEQQVITGGKVTHASIAGGGMSIGMSDVQRRGVSLAYLEDLDQRYHALLNQIVDGRHPWSRHVKVHSIPNNVYDVGAQRALELVHEVLT